jgi:radical SAM protein with 4Fe4S-binding SPASM domain
MTTNFCNSKYDRRKLLFHPRAIADILEKGDTWPVTVNTGFTTYCNHSCIWCSTAYTTRIKPTLKERDDLLIQPEVWIENIRLLAKHGTKGLIIAGQGEPLLHPKADIMLEAVAEADLKYMLFTNGQKLHEKYYDSFFRSGLAIRFSVDAASSEMHEKWHAAESENGKGRSNFTKVLDNISALVAEKKRRKSALPHIGCQMICSAMTQPDFENFAKLFREIGVDYVVYKSLQSNPGTRGLIASSLSIHNSLEERSQYAADMLTELEAIKAKYQSDTFDVFIKSAQIETAYVKEFNGAENYKKCRAHSLTPMIEPDGKVYLCVDHGGVESMVIGNIYQQNIEEIWLSEKRQQVISSIDLVNKCPAGCFLDEANMLLEELSTPDDSLHWQLI